MLTSSVLVVVTVHTSSVLVVVTVAASRRFVVASSELWWLMAGAGNIQRLRRGLPRLVHAWHGDARALPSSTSSAAACRLRFCF
jgi:hypothetical protein